MADRGERRGKISLELGDDVGPPIGEAILRELPDPFVGIQLGRVGGKAFQPETRELAAEEADEQPLVDLAVVPEHDDGAAEVAEQVAEERADVPLSEVLGV